MRELSPAVRLGAFGVTLAAVLAGALALGRATGDVAQADPAPTASAHDGGHDTGGTATAAAGTALATGGYRLDVPVPVLPPSLSTVWEFRVLDDAGEPLRAEDLDEGTELHLVIVSRDLSRMAHLHPEPAADGTWRTRLTLSPGSYRAVVDVSTGGERHALGIDLAAPGPLEPSPLPPPALQSVVDDLRVELTREGDRLSFTAFRGEAPVVPEPYLDARGHLTAFRAGDLAYAHVHPAGEDGATTSYDVELPGAGAYRLFLELQVDGTVRTFAFTLEETA